MTKIACPQCGSSSDKVIEQWWPDVQGYVKCACHHCRIPWTARLNILETLYYVFRAWWGRR